LPTTATATLLEQQDLRVAFATAFGCRFEQHDRRSTSSSVGADAVCRVVSASTVVSRRLQQHVPDIFFFSEHWQPSLATRAGFPVAGNRKAINAIGRPIEYAKNQTNSAT